MRSGVKGHPGGGFVGPKSSIGKSRMLFESACRYTVADTVVRSPTRSEYPTSKA